MDAELKIIRFKNVTISGQEARVLTSEEWGYEYRNIENKQVAVPASSIYYEMEYILLKRDNKWIITVINIISERLESPKIKVKEQS